MPLSENGWITRVRGDSRTCETLFTNSTLDTLHAWSARQTDLALDSLSTLVALGTWSTINTVRASSALETFVSLTMTSQSTGLESRGSTTL
jgi:hypothetical protein